MEVQRTESPGRPNGHVLSTTAQAIVNAINTDAIVKAIDANALTDAIVKAIDTNALTDAIVEAIDTRAITDAITSGLKDVRLTNAITGTITEAVAAGLKEARLTSETAAEASITNETIETRKHAIMPVPDTQVSMGATALREQTLGPLLHHSNFHFRPSN